VCLSWAKLQQLRFQPQIVLYVLFATEPFIGLWAKFHIIIFACGKIHDLWDLGCFPLCQTDRLETSGTNQGKMEWHCLIETNSQLDWSVPFMFGPKFWLLFSKVGLEMRISEHGRASFSQTGPTGQRGPPLEEETTKSFSGKFPPGPKCSIYVSTEISGNFSRMKSTSFLLCELIIR